MASHRYAQTGFMMVALVVCLVSGVAARAHDGQPLQQTTVEYDVRELLVDIPDFGNVPEDGPPQATPTRTREQLAEALIESLRLELGDALPAGAEVRDQKLVVTAGAATHRAIEAAVEELKRLRRLQMNVEVRFVVSTLEELGRLDESLRRKIARASVAPQILSQAEFATLLEKGRDDGEARRSLTAPSITLFNQQKASVLVQSRHSYVKEARRGNAPPVQGAVGTGLRLSVRAGVTEDGVTPAAAIEGRLQRLLHMEKLAIGRSEEFREVPIVERYDFAGLAQGSEGAVLLEVGRYRRWRLEQVPEPAEVEVAGPAAGANGEERLLILVRLQPIKVRVIEPAEALQHEVIAPVTPVEE